MQKDLFKRLKSLKKEVWEAALAEAQALLADQLLELIKVDSLAYRKGKIVGLILYGILATLLLEGNKNNLFLGSGLAVLILGQDFLSGLASASYKRGHSRILELLEESNDLRFLEPAIRFLENNRDRGNVKIASATIKRLLTGLTIEQMQNLTPPQRQALLVPLARPLDDVELTLLILKSLEQVGDEKAVEAVERLTILKNCFPDRSWLGFSTPERASWRIQEAACQCLPYLKLNSGKAAQYQTLLRPAEGVVPGSETLLRPARTRDEEVASHELLRPS